MEKNNPAIAFNVLYAKKEKIYPACFKTFKSCKASSSFNETKSKRMALSCSNKTISIIKRNNIKTILQFNQYKKSDEAPLIIYADLKYLIEKIDGCKTNPVNSSTAKLSEHIPLDFSMTTISSFKHGVYRGKDCVKKFCESLRERALEMIDFKNKKKKLLTKEQ